MAFPSWMGICCGYSRHDGNNPGTITILMNQDYYGLHADVVMRVNGGTWTTNAMTYMGNTSGNSIWQYTPTTAFKGGSTIEYAFHGWDNWSGSIWDNNGGADYEAVMNADWVGASRSNQVQTVGNTKRVLFFLNSAITNDAGLCEVVPWAPDMVRVRYHFTPGTNDLYANTDISISKTLTNWPSHNVHITNSGQNIWIETDELDVECVVSPYFHVNFYDKAGYLLHAGIRFEYNEFYQPEQDMSYFTIYSGNPSPMPEGMKVGGVFLMPDDEQYYGLGQYPGPINRRNKITQWWNTDNYSYGEHWNPIYMSMPMFYGVQPQDGTNHPAFTYGIFFNNPARPVFDMATNQYDEFYLEAGDGQMDYFFLGGGEDHQMSVALTRYADLTGLPAKFPKWAYGHHMSRWSYPSEAAVEGIVGAAVSNDCPMDAVYLDIDYMDVNGDNYYEDNTLKPLSFNSNFPDPAGLIEFAQSNGVQLVPLIEAWYTERTNDALYKQLHTNAHTIHNINGDPVWHPDVYFGDLWWFDYTSGPMRDWWGGALTDFLQDYPFPGIWNDLNEPADAYYHFEQNDVYWLSSGTNESFNRYDSRRWHVNIKNTYNIYETSHTRNTLQTNFPEQTPFVLSRSGWPGIQRYSMGWSGDNVSSWDSSRFNISMGLSVMISGQANFGHDIGGFAMPGASTNDRPAGDLMTRWYEWAAFMPFFRNHSAKFNAHREPWVYSSPYKESMIEVIKFRYKLMPYLYTLAYESTQSGLPMNTPTVMHFTGDTNTYNQNYDFMVGDWLLAAPIYEANVTSRWVYLPDGPDYWYQVHDGAYWFDWHNHEKYSAGQWVQVATEVGYLPLFARDGAIVPQGPSMQHANAFKPDYLDVHMWPSTNDTEWTLYEDDGINPTSATLRTTFVNDDSSSRWDVTIDEAVGSYDPERDSYILILHDIASFTNVMVNNTNLTARAGIVEVRTNTAEGYYHYSTVNELTIKVNNAGEGDEVVVQK